MLELSFGLRPVFLDSPKEVRLFTRCKKRCFLLSKLNFARWQSKSRIRPKKNGIVCQIRKSMLRVTSLSELFRKNIKLRQNCK